MNPSLPQPAGRQDWPLLTLEIVNSLLLGGVGFLLIRMPAQMDVVHAETRAVSLRAHEETRQVLGHEVRMLRQEVVGELRALPAEIARVREDARP